MTLASEILSYKIDIMLVYLMAILAIVVLVDMVYKWCVFLAASRRERQAIIRADVAAVAAEEDEDPGEVS